MFKIKKIALLFFKNYNQLKLNRFENINCSHTTKETIKVPETLQQLHKQMHLTYVLVVATCIPVLIIVIQSLDKSYNIYLHVRNEKIRSSFTQPYGIQSYKYVIQFLLLLPMYRQSCCECRFTKVHKPKKYWGSNLSYDLFSYG